jgi:putative thiamine transport system permease protein
MSQIRQMLGAGPLVLLLLLPLTLSLMLLLPDASNATAFAQLASHPQITGALGLSLFTSVVSTVLALMLSISVVSALQDHDQSRAGLYLAAPHLALAIGFAFLIAPTGLLARAIATMFTGWTSPPQWQTTQDPYGLALMAALILKETPFLVWAMASVFNQDELKQRFQNEVTVARSLGHSRQSAFLRVVLPQLLKRNVWPIVAVFTYALTVVDMALVIGPTQPPTLAQLVWTDLNDGEAVANARGAAGTLLLSAVAFLLLVVTYGIGRLARPSIRNWLTRAPQATSSWSHGVECLVCRLCVHLRRTPASICLPVLAISEIACGSMVIRKLDAGLDQYGSCSHQPCTGALNQCSGTSVCCGVV